MSRITPFGRRTLKRLRNYALRLEILLERAADDATSVTRSAPIIKLIRGSIQAELHLSRRWFS